MVKTFNPLLSGGFLPAATTSTGLPVWGSFDATDVTSHPHENGDLPNVDAPDSRFRGNDPDVFTAFYGDIPLSLLAADAKERAAVGARRFASAAGLAGSKARPPVFWVEGHDPCSMSASSLKEVVDEKLRRFIEGFDAIRAVFPTGEELRTAVDKTAVLDRLGTAVQRLRDYIESSGIKKGFSLGLPEEGLQSVRISLFRHSILGFHASIDTQSQLFRTGSFSDRILEQYEQYRTEVIAIRHASLLNYITIETCIKRFVFVIPAPACHSRESGNLPSAWRGQAPAGIS